MRLHTPREDWTLDIVRLAASVAAVLGFAVALIAIVPRGVIDDGGAGGGDAHAYWVAGRNALVGADLYTGISGGKDAYLYPPPFAQILGPVAGALSATSSVWAWRLFSVACLIFATRGWRSAGIALLVFPPAIVELDMGNVHFQLAALCALALRSATWALPVAFLLKLAGGGAVPFALERNWRGVAAGSAVVALVVVMSVALSPRAWLDYASFLGRAHEMEYWTNLGLGIPLIVRLAAAGAVGVAAVRFPVLMPVAFVLSMPMLSLNSLAILVCVAPIVADWVERARGRWNVPRIEPSMAAGSNAPT